MSHSCTVSFDMQYLLLTEVNPTFPSQFSHVSCLWRLRCSSSVLRLFEYHSDKPFKSRSLVKREGKRNKRKFEDGTVKMRTPSSLRTLEASRRTPETCGMCSRTLLEIKVPMLLDRKGNIEPSAMPKLE